MKVIINEAIDILFYKCAKVANLNKVFDFNLIIGQAFWENTSTLYYLSGKITKNLDELVNY